MTRYTATICHHSVNAPSYDVGDTLSAAKRNATRLLGDGFHGHVIVITDTTLPSGHPDAEVARRVIGERGGWQNY